MAGRRRRSDDPRGAGRRRLRLLLPALPLGRRERPVADRAAAAGLRLDLAPGAAGRSRDLGRRHHQQWPRRHHAGRPRPGDLGPGHPQLPAARALAGGRADHGRRRDGGHPRRPSLLLARRGPADDRRRGGGRCVGGHQPVPGPGRLHRPPSRRGPASRAPVRARRRPVRPRSLLDGGHRGNRRPPRGGDPHLRPASPGRDRRPARRPALRDRRPELEPRPVDPRRGRARPGPAAGGVGHRRPADARGRRSSPTPRCWPRPGPSRPTPRRSPAPPVSELLDVLAPIRASSPV